jgi:WLM domain
MIDLDKHSILVYIIIIFVIFVGIKVYSESDAYNLKCIISDVDGERYCVRERNKLQMAADLLAKVTAKCKELVAYCGKKYPDNEDVQRLVQKFNPTTISETLPTSEHTAYSENKGEKIAFCLNKKKEGTKLIDLNTLTFVAIHELSHVMTKTEGHNREFWSNFKFLLINAKEANIYNPVDYKNKPRDYCGMKITDNPYYDFN